MFVVVTPLRLKSALKLYFAPTGRIIRKLFMRLGILFFLLFLNSSLVQAQRLVIYEEDGPPFGYVKNGKIPAPIAEFVRAIVIRAGYEPEIRRLSWVGIMHMVENDQSILFYPLARTAEREDKYIWLGSLIHSHGYYFYKKKNRSDIEINKLDDAKSYRVGVIDGDAREQFLKANNFKLSNSNGLIHIVNNIEGFRLLAVGRLDLLPISEESFEINCTPTCQDYVPAFNLGLDFNLELGATKSTSPEVIERLRRAYLSLQKDGTHLRMIGEN